MPPKRGHGDLSLKCKGDPVAVEGILRFQACDDRVCFPPQEVPLRWVLNVVAFDGERVPGEFRHKSKNQE